MVSIKRIVAVIIVLLLVILIYMYFQISVFKVQKTIIKQDKDTLKEKIRFIQISDYHNNNLINKKRLIKKIEKLDPDFIVLTGDIIDSQTQDFDNVIDFLSQIKRVNENIYSVTGNHEKYNKKSQEFDRRKEEIGIYNLDNKYVSLDIGGAKINLCGVPFDSQAIQQEGLWDGLSGELFTILLSHSPKHGLRNKEFRKDLIVSGHIHGGQVRLPFIGAVVSPEDGFFPKHTKGLYDVEDSKLYIDSGLGNSVAPIRAFNRIQISYIEIK